MPPVASSNGSCGRAAGLERGQQIGDHGQLAPIGELLADDLDRLLLTTLAGQHAGVGLQHAHRRRAGLRHRAAQNRHRLLQVPAQIEHHRLVIAVQRARATRSGRDARSASALSVPRSCANSTQASTNGTVRPAMP